ncbi:hypothetical protein ACEWY4_008216 [Coilia grayii]|uniref:C2H2-type domain-containing protein n=1 Tax=Coilia grayii TaxID=363190 RepID=A0ABD1KA92_9TELE
MVTSFNCPLCNRSFFSLIKQIRHIGLYHQNESNFALICGLEGCMQSCRCYASYRTHVYRKHRDLFFCVSGSQRMYSEDMDEVEAGIIDDFPNAAVGLEQHVVQSENYRAEDLLCGLKRNLCLFILKVREKHCVPVAVHSSIAEDLRTIFDTFLANYSEAIRFHLARRNFIVDDDDDLNELLCQNEVFDECVKAISTEWTLEQYCHNRLGMVRPVEKILRDDEGNHRATFQYIPLLDVLQKVCENDDVWAMLNNDTSTSEDLLRDFSDGDLCKSNPLLCKKHTLQLKFYIDEFEVVNPVGSKRGKHKLTAVYFKIGNLDNKFLSQLQNTYLSTLVRHKLIQTGCTDYDEVFHPLLSDVRILETQGVSLKCGGEEKIFHSTIATVSADNLSAHDVSGLTRTFSSGRICRFCNATSEDIKTKFTEDEFVLRNTENYQYQLEAVREHPENVGIYGIRHACCFAKLKFVPSPIVYLFPPDIMHDLLEGIIPTILTLVLGQLVREKQIKLPQLNYEIHHFPYGINDRQSKPPPIPDQALRPGGRLPGTASEKWTLFRLLPQMIGNQILDCPAWDVYLYLRGIGDIIMAPIIKKSWLPYLDEMITTFLSLTEKVFPGVHTPKMHYLLHYPRLLMGYGPVIHLSCLRFEAKHQYFKNIARTSCNFKNIAKTLAKRHQMRQCWEQADYCLGKRFMLTSDTRDFQDPSLELCSANWERMLLLSMSLKPGPLLWMQLHTRLAAVLLSELCMLRTFQCL